MLHAFEECNTHYILYFESQSYIDWSDAIYFINES